MPLEKSRFLYEKIILVFVFVFCIAITNDGFTFAMNLSFNIHSRIYLFCHKALVFI